VKKHLAPPPLLWVNGKLPRRLGDLSSSLGGKTLSGCQMICFFPGRLEKKSPNIFPPITKLGGKSFFSHSN